MTLTPLAPFPVAPTRLTDSDTFNAETDAFLARWVAFVPEFNALLVQIPGQVNPANFNTVSASSLAIGTGAKTFTVEPNKLFYAGQWLLMLSTASPTNYMAGQVTSYNGSTGSLVMDVAYASGSGTIVSWTIGPCPPPATAAGANVRAVTAPTTTGTITPDAAHADLYVLAGLTGPVTIAAPSGTPVAGQKLMLRIKDDGTSRALTWNAVYRPFGTVSLPSATTVGKDHYAGLIWNAVSSAWDVISLAIQQ